MRALLVAALLAGCAKKSETAYWDPQQPVEYYEEADDGYAPEPVAAAESVSSSRSEVLSRDFVQNIPSGRSYQSAVQTGKDKSPSPPPPPAPAPRPRPAPAPAPAPAPSPDPAAPEQAEEAPARMVHYDGHATLRATDPDETLDAIAAVAVEAGGKVERLAGRDISVRVPVDAFDAVWEEVLGLGDVLSRSVRADDVTEQYMAIDLRVRTLRATRDRLVALLAKAKEEHEKLQLLREITRVTEELDAVEARLRTLAELAALSRISATVMPREAFAANGGRPALDGFQWIDALSPFRRAPFYDETRVDLPVPEGLVALNEEGPFIAESADGAVLWTLRLNNDPVGSAGFWIDAVASRVGDEFAGTEPRAVGPWSCLEADEPGDDEEPYHWQVCAQIEGRHLYVAQAYYPTPAALERYRDGVDAALAVVGGGS